LIHSVVSLPPLIFRLDDLQCSWEMNTSYMIIDVFFKYNVPISVGVITGHGDCYKPDLLKRFTQSNGDLEVCSHTVDHIPMTTFNYSEQLFQAANSKAELEALLGNGTVRTFIPPTNVWNFDTISVLQESGYDIISGQCTAAQLFWPGFDYMCTPNMYQVRPSFFARINGIIHMPTGASEANFADLGQLLTMNQLFYGTNSDCYQNSNCSVQSQLNGMANLTDANDGPWSVIMMHPQDFPQDANFIESYFSAVFAIAKKNYRLVTFSQLAGPKGSRPYVTSNAATTWVSLIPTSNSTPTSALGPSNWASKKVPKISFFALAILTFLIY